MSHANELARRIVVLQRGAGFLSLELPHELQRRDVGQHIEQHLAAIAGILAAAVDPDGHRLSIRFAAASLSTAQVATFGDMTYVAEIIKNILFAIAIFIHARYPFEKPKQKPENIPYLDLI